MAGSVSDEAFARAAQQAGVVTFDELEGARAAQAESAKKGVATSLADVLVKQGLVRPNIRENIEKKILADQQTGGIKQLGPYKLLKKLGEGGMGAVYLADDTSVGRKVAVKVLPKKYSEDREFLTRFRREAQATGKLNHVNIVMAYNVGEDAGTHYYAMEHCDGDTLDRILKRDKVIPWDAAVAVVLQVARGLKHAHDHGIIHRDIKPANIFICAPVGRVANPPHNETFAEGFVAKILDLGLSKNISGDEQSFYTQTGVALGTPHYISPEQAKGEKGIDGRTDIYSLGATFYHLVTGQTPFQGSTAALIMMKHLSEELPNPRDVNPEIPEGVAQVIAKMMAKEPADRYANCKELLDDLELVIDGKTPSSQAIDVGKSSVAVARAPRRAATAPRKIAGPLQPVGTRQQQPVAERRRLGRHAADSVPMQEVPAAPASKRNVYIAAGVLGLGAITFIAALVFSGKPDSGHKIPDTGSQIPDSGTPKAATGAATGPSSLKSQASSLVWPLHDGKEPIADYAKRVGLPATETLDLGGGVKMELVLVPAGEFMMGSNDGGSEDKPIHKVRISKPFYLGKYEVTQAQYEKVTGTNPSKFKGADLPVEQVSWDDAKRLCEAAHKVARSSGSRGDQEGRPTLRLPTDAQWEYACRAGTTTEYNTGQGEAALEKAGWYGKNSAGKTNPVGKKAPNAWGLHDMHGNVWEWCEDWHGERFYAVSPPADPAGPATGHARVMRGGSWCCILGFCRSADPHRYGPGDRNHDIGFRVVLDVADGASVAVQPQTTNQKPEIGVTDAWIKMVQAQPAEKQVVEVVKKLKELNPGLSGAGKATSTVFDLAYNNSVRDISALKALRELRGLACHHSSVTDLSPLKDLPLRELICDFKPERDAAVLRSIKTLERINGMSVAEFWKKVDAELAAKAAAGGDRPWKPIFDGKTLDGLRLERPDGWDVQGGVLVKRTGGTLWSAAKYRDGEVRFRFEVSDLSGEQFSVRHTGLGEWCIFFDRGQLARLQGKVNELAFRCEGDAVTASLNGEAAKVGKAANPSQDGSIKLHSVGNGVLRILSIEYRELPSLGAAQPDAGKVDDPEQWRNAIDLLALIDPKKDAVKGQWEVQDGALVSDNAEPAKLQAPYRPPPEYDFRVGFTRRTGGEYVLQVLSASGRQFYWAMGGAKKVCGFGMIAEKHAAVEENPSRLTLADGIRDGQRYTAVVQVRPDGVAAWLDGKLVAKWKTDYKDMSVDATFRLNAAILLGLASYGSPTAFHAVDVLEVKGKGEFTRPDDPAAKEAKKKQDEVWAKREKTGAAQPDAGALPKELSLDLGGGAKMEMVLAPAGEFMMGSNDGDGNEKPAHKVKISKPYYIGTYAVTVAQFRAFADAAKFQTEAERQNKGFTVKDGKWQGVSGVHWRNPGFKQEDNHPVVVVTWNDAQEFCKWTTNVAQASGLRPQSGGLRYTVRLPTEAEWEYAARGPKGLKYPWGDTWDAKEIKVNVADASLRRAGFNMQWGEIKEDDGFPFTSPGGAYKNASWCGAYDMAGNVWQWCQDRWSDKYYQELPNPAVDPQGPATGNFYVTRGGAWSSPPGNSRCSCRPFFGLGGRASHHGFRVVVEPAKAP